MAIASTPGGNDSEPVEASNGLVVLVVRARCAIASCTTPALINGRSYWIDETAPAVVTSDAQGKVTVVIETAFLDAPVLKVTGKDVPMPYAANLEKLALPSVREVIDAAKAVTYRA